MTTDQNGRLVGWKAIAAYVGKDVRTVLRWERERGMPIHRPPGARGQSVYALPAEIDQWMQRREPTVDPPPAPRDTVPPAFAPEAAPLQRRRRVQWRWLAVPLMLFLAVGAYAARPRPMLARVAVERLAVRGYDDTGRELWAYPLEGRVATLSVDNGVGRTMHIGDVDGDGSIDAIVSVLMTHEAPDAVRSALLCFESDGRLKWAQSLDDEIVAGGRRFAGPWAGNDLLVYGNARKRVLWTTHHYTWSPSVVVTLDAASGTRISRYVHDGWLMRTDVTQDLRHIIAAGIAHHDEHAVAVLNEKDLSEHAYFVIPRPDASSAGGETLDRQSFAISQSRMPTIRFGHSRSVDSNPETIVELSPDLRGYSATRSEGYWTWHRALEREGKIAHAAERCPERAITSKAAQ